MFTLMLSFLWKEHIQAILKQIPDSILFEPHLLSSIQFSHSVISDSLWPHGLQHARLPCPSPTPTVCSNSCPSSQWHHPTIPSSVVPFSSHLHSFPASGSFPTSQFFASGGQSIGASASVLPMNIQDWFPSGWTGWISSTLFIIRVFFYENKTTISALNKIKNYFLMSFHDLNVITPDSLKNVFLLLICLN